MNLIPLIDESRLVELVHDPALGDRRWDVHASCADLPTASDPYFPDDGELPPVEALTRCIS